MSSAEICTQYAKCFTSESQTVRGFLCLDNWPRQAKRCLRTCANALIQINPAQKPHSGICSPVIHSTVSNDFVSGQQRPWLYCGYVLADLGLRCPHMPVWRASYNQHLPNVREAEFQQKLDSHWVNQPFERYISRTVYGTNFTCDLLVPGPTGLKPDLNVDGPLEKSDGLTEEQSANLSELYHQSFDWSDSQVKFKEGTSVEIVLTQFRKWACYKKKEFATLGSKFFFFLLK